MKNLKLILASLSIILSFSQYFVWGFLPETAFWAIYCVVYFLIALYQRFHEPTLRLGGITFFYVLIPLVILFAYEVSQGFPKMTLWFYLIFMILLFTALVWETILFLATLRQKLDEKKERK